MNPLLLTKALPWVLAVAVALGLALGLMTNLYLEKRDALAIEKTRFDTFVAGVERKGRDAEAEKARKDAEHKQTLAQIKETHESQIPRVRADAVANYRASIGLRQRSATNPGSGELRGNGAGVRLDDGAQRQCVLDETLIQNAAEDAAKLGAWQQYCRMSRCPVTE